MQAINSEISELCGIILGDGNIHKSSNKITIVGSLNDLYYFKNRVIPLIKNNFIVRPYILRRNDRNAYYITIESKEFLNYFLSIGLSRGPKINISIPRLILENKKFSINFIRGLFDTDGSVKFSKQNRKIGYYPRIRLYAKKSQLANEIGLILKKLNFNHSLCVDKRCDVYHYEISGNKNFIRWFKEIKPQNLVHQNKYLIWRKLND